MLKVSNNTAEFPGEDDADLPVSATLMGSMVSRAELNMSAKNAIKALIRLVRGDHLAHYARTRSRWARRRRRIRRRRRRTRRV